MAIDLGTARGRIEIDASSVFTEMQNVGRSIQKFQSSAALAMVGITTAIGGVTAAVGLMKKGWEQIERGTELMLVENRFERLAESIGSTGDVLLDRLDDATNGMMTSAQLMSSATDIMSLGLGKTEDQTVRLATVVSKLGWDMQQVILTFANNSKLRLDALGLSVESVTERAKALEEQGYSTDAAFDMAVIEAGEAKIQLLGDASQTTRGKLQQLKAAAQEAQDQFALGAAEGFAVTLDGMAGDATAVAEALGAMAYSVGNLTRYIPDATVWMERFMGVVAPWANTLREIATLAGVGLGGKLLEDTLDAQAFERQLAVAQDGLEDWAIIVEQASDEADGFGRGVLAVGAHLRIAGERFKEATAGSGKFGDQLDALKEQARAAAAEIEAAAARAQTYADAFAAVQGDYTVELPDADEPLVSPEQTVNIVTRVSGPTEEQQALAERYTQELERLRETYIELTGGIGTFGMEQDKLNERITETAGEIAYYEGLLAGIPPTVENVSTAQQGLAVNVDAVRQGIYDQLVAIGAAPDVIAAYAAATGIMSAAQAEAVLQAAAVQVKIEELAQAIAEGMPIDDALADLDAFISKIETGAAPAAKTLATDVPQRVIEMKDAMSEHALAAGEAVPTNIAEGITTMLPEAEGAAVDVADAVLAAWNETIAGSDEIGAAMINGVIVGAESRREALKAKMMEIALSAHDATMTALDAHSPSRLFIEMGAETIIGAIIRGLDEEEGTLYGKMADVADELYRVATAGLAWLGDPLEISLRAQGDVIDDLSGQLDDALGQFGDLGLRLGADVVERLRGMSSEGLRAALYGLRYSNEYLTTPAIANEVERLIALADQRAAAEAETLRLQEELAAVEEDRLALQREQMRLSYLQAQIDLVNMVRELHLSTDLLEGLELGLDANADDLVETMRRVMAQLIDAAEDQLEIASPSRVAYDLMENFMGSMARSIDDNAAGPIAALSDTYAAMRDLSERALREGLTPDGNRLAAEWLMGLSGQRAGATPADVRQAVTVYGGINVTAATAPTDPLREQFWEWLGYQGG